MEETNNKQVKFWKNAFWTTVTILVATLIYIVYIFAKNVTFS